MTLRSGVQLGVVGKDISMMFSGKQPVPAEEYTHSFWEVYQRLPLLNYFCLGRQILFTRMNHEALL
jgi:hypothetical protein